MTLEKTIYYILVTIMVVFYSGTVIIWLSEAESIMVMVVARIITIPFFILANFIQNEMIPKVKRFI